MLDEEKPIVCELNDGTNGLCCTTGQNHTTPKYLTRLRENRVDRDIDWDLDEIRGEAQKEFNELLSRSPRSVGGNEVAFHQIFGSSKLDIDGQNEGIVDALASRRIQKR